MRGSVLILLTKLDDSPVLINLETVKYCESTPDTRIIFVNGDSVIVKENLETIENKVVALKSRIVKEASPS